MTGEKNYCMCFVALSKMCNNKDTKRLQFRDKNVKGG